MLLHIFLQDGLHLVTEHPDVVKNYKKAILTPNIVEFTRLYEKMVSTNVNCSMKVCPIWFVFYNCNQQQFVTLQKHFLHSDWLTCWSTCLEICLRLLAVKGKHLYMAKSIHGKPTLRQGKSHIIQN